MKYKIRTALVTAALVAAAATTTAAPAHAHFMPNDPGQLTPGTTGGIFCLPYWDFDAGAIKWVCG